MHVRAMPTSARASCQGRHAHADVGMAPCAKRKRGGRMVDVTINGEVRTLPTAPTIAGLLRDLHYDPRRVAVEVNRKVVPSPEHERRILVAGDAVEIVTLVGGGSGMPPVKPLAIGKFRFSSRLI